MRWGLGIALGLLGCNLLPQKDLPCSQYASCEPAPPDMSVPPVITAPFVLGQPDENTNLTTRGLNTPRALALIGTKLAACDTANNRVLIWNTIPTQNNAPADVVLGQPNFTTNSANHGGLSATTMNGPVAVWSDGTRLLVSDGANNRTLIWNAIPTQSGQPADTLWGQLDFTKSASAGAASDSSSGSGGFAQDGSGKFYLVDRPFHRVLVFPGIPTKPGDKPINVLGQSDFVSGAAQGGAGTMVVSANGLYQPFGAAMSPSGKLWIVDRANQRLLGFSVPPTNKAAATGLLGHSVYTSGATTSPPSAQSLFAPNAVAFAPAASTVKLAVADSGNLRVLLWKSDPPANGQSADLVVGQATFTKISLGSVSATSLSSPEGVAMDAQRLVVADAASHRVLIYSPVPTTSGAAASVVLGQSDMNTAVVLGALPVSANKWAKPVAMAEADGQLYVADATANRVLIYAGLPTAPSVLPVAAIGQGSLGDNKINVGGGGQPVATGLDTPLSVASENGSLAVVDSANHRVLLWKKAPRRFGTAPDVILGQADDHSKNYGSSGGAGLATPAWVHLSGGRIYVADNDNNRVLIWKQFPTANMQQADIVLGQADFSGVLANRNNGAATAGNMWGPTTVFTDSSRTYVSDARNYRVLIWNSLEPATGANADRVLGKSVFTDGTSPMVMANTLLSPAGIALADGRLYIADLAANRILSWSPLPTTSGAAADKVLGQSSLTSAIQNAGGLAVGGLNSPNHILKTAAGIYVADSGNGRIVALPADAF